MSPSPRLREDDWDLTPVIDLIYSLSVSEEAYAPRRILDKSSSPSQESQLVPGTKENGYEQSTQLGDFDKIWQYLGQPVDLLPPKVTPAPEGEFVEILESCGSDRQSLLKGVKWRDELEGGGLADKDELDDPQYPLKLTKTQRKKAGRKRRQRDVAEALVNGRALPIGSEDEPGKDIQTLQMPDRESIIYEIINGAPPAQNATSRLRSGKGFRPKPPIDHGTWPVASAPSTKQVTKILNSTTKSPLAAAAAKKAKLMTMLNEAFVDERQYLRNISVTLNVSSNTIVTVEGVHVFVDASNIMIGFHDALKLSRGQPIAHRIRRQPISFRNLSLILERGRPSAKRIVVGSDNFPAMQEAKAIGYETNILDRVHKAKELTPRQKKYKSTNGNGTGTGTGTGSGSETTAAVQFAPEKWVEQAVDEILHLKMMESVVDASEPSIMVLATGDAAEAEYSGGFLKMVERALGKGWKIELASFRHNTSGAYKRKEFRQKWGERFKIVELDDFVEVLLGAE